MIFNYANAPNLGDKCIDDIMRSRILDHSDAIIIGGGGLIYGNPVSYTHLTLPTTPYV